MNDNDIITIEALASRIADLERQLARGTRDLAPPTTKTAAVPPTPPVQPKHVTSAPPPVQPKHVPSAQPRETLAQSVERVLRSRPASMLDLVEATGGAAGPVSELVRRTLRPAGKVCNVGTEERPLWYWVVGDDASPEELNEAIGTLLRIRPFYHHELRECTGARSKRVDGAIDYWRKLMEEDDHAWIVHDLTRVDGKRTARGRWFMLPNGLRPARLASAIAARKKRQTRDRRSTS